VLTIVTMDSTQRRGRKKSRAQFGRRPRPGARGAGGGQAGAPSIRRNNQAGIFASSSCGFRST
jgi:hypothetical protein